MHDDDINLGVVQYEAFIRQNETELIDSEILLQQVTQFCYNMISFKIYPFFRSTMLLQAVNSLSMLLSSL